MKIVTGNPDYVKRKCSELYKEGYTLLKSHKHPDGSITVKLAYIRF